MEVDAVVTWVDGGDRMHAEKRREWLARTNAPLLKKAAIPLRFSDYGELRYCLRSIRHHAPWVRTIFLVTDDQVPSFIDAKAAALLGLRIVDHRTVFRRCSQFLPTFNSCAIETMMWQIPGLSEHFLYFNDDTFLCRALKPRDFFRDDKVILRGRRVDWTTRITSNTHGRAQLRGAALTGADMQRGFIEAHVPHPVRRSVLKSLATRLPEEFSLNAARRFRDRHTFSPIAMHNADCIRQHKALLLRGSATTYITAKECLTRDGDYLRHRIAPVLEGRRIMFCINDLGTARSKVPEIDRMMEQIVGGPLLFEKDRLTAAGSAFRLYVRLRTMLRYCRPRRLRKLLDGKRFGQKTHQLQVDRAA